MHALKLTILFVLPIILLILGLTYVFFINRGLFNNLINTIILKEYIDPMGRDLDNRILSNKTVKEIKPQNSSFNNQNIKLGINNDNDIKTTTILNKKDASRLENIIDKIKIVNYSI